MALLTDFYVAPASEAQAILDDIGSERASYQTKGIDPTKLESLEKLLAKSTKAGETAIITDQDAEQWVFVVSPKLVKLLAAAKPADVAAVAKKWAASPEFKGDRWTAAEVKKVLTKLAQLAGEATKAKTQLLLLMSL